jgi:acyl-CoA synthetase (AMP-forming)/AMP-acid ligase II
MTGINVCSRILEAGLRQPGRLAISVPRAADGYRSSDRLTYGELLAQAGARQQALRRIGLTAGDRVLLLARPGIALYVLMVALLASGIVPVLIDRGMSRARMVAALRASGARVAIGERGILRWWWMVPALWRMRRYALDGRALGVATLSGGQAEGAPALECVPLPAEAHGLITFTSGSTGAPKGADRTHGSLVEQHLAIRAHWPDRDDDIDMSCFPVLVLHNLCCGISTVMPAVDLATPGNPDAARVLEQLMEDGVTRVSAAPAFVSKLVQHALQHDVKLTTVRSLVVGGATLPPGLAERCLCVFPQADCRIVYGSTEAEPIAEIGMADFIAQGDAGRGHLLGHPASVTEVCIVDAALPLASDADVERAQLPAGATGEILVAGRHVLHGYVDNPAANRETKIARADGLVWHRTGDAGHLDAQGRLWLEGRLKDAVLVVGALHHTFAIEKAIDALPGVERSALLQDDTGGVALVLAGQPLEPARLRAVLQRHGIAAVRRYQVAAMPVDGRHNSKIDRVALREALKRGRLMSLGAL